MTETAARQFKRKRSITLTTLKFVVDQPLFVKITGKLHEGKTRVGRNGEVKKDSDGNPRKPPTLIEIVDLTTGEQCQLIAAEVIKSELAEAYPNDGYVGRGFEMCKQKRKEGKQYDPYSIIEIELPDEYKDAPAAPAAEVKGAKK